MHSPESHTYREIMSQGQTWRAVLESLPVQIEAVSSWAKHPASMSSGSEEVLVIGCGSTYYLSLSAAAFWRRLVRQPARALPASEIWLFPEFCLLQQPSRLLVISRSGETTETLKALEVFRSRSLGESLAITCYPQSSLARLADRCLAVTAAQEQSVAQTRSFSSMFLLAQAVACHLGGRLDLLDQLAALSSLFDSLVEKYEALARQLAEDLRLERVVFLGSGMNYGLACEAMLKMKEMSLTPSEAFHFMEFRHGPKSVVGPGTLIIGLISASARQAEAQVLSEMRTLGATILAVAESGSDLAADYCIELNSGLDDLANRILVLPALQLLGYYRALEKGLDPDHPTNLEAVVRL